MKHFTNLKPKCHAYLSILTCNLNQSNLIPLKSNTSPSSTASGKNTEQKTLRKLKQIQIYYIRPSKNPEVIKNYLGNEPHVFTQEF